MIIKRSSITATNQLNIGYSLTDFVKPFPYPINNIDTIKVKGNFIKNKDNDIVAKLTISGSLDVRDSRDDSIFSYPIKISDSYLLFDEDDGEKEGYLLDNLSEINLNDLVLKIIMSSLPIALHKDDSTLPTLKGDIRVLTDKELKEESVYNPAFDGLAKLDL